MKRRIFALLFAGIAAALTFLIDARPPGEKLHAVFTAKVPPANPEIVAIIETAGPPTPLDAALILRATQRFRPKGVTFFNPLTGEDGRALLQSRLAEISFPVQFAAASRGITAPEETPTDRWTRRMTFDRLMVRGERSERGEIGADLDNFFRDRWIVVQMPGESGAERLAAAKNPETAAIFLPGIAIFAVFAAASLPWWIGGRLHRFTVALVLTIIWLAAAFVCGRNHVALPLAAMIVLPLLALIPPPLNEVERRVSPA